MLALALVLAGHLRSNAVALNGMHRQTLRNWVHRHNVEGVDGLKSHKSLGREPSLNEQQKVELREPVVLEPEPDIHKVVRWRYADLRQFPRFDAGSLRQRIRSQGRTLAKMEIRASHAS